MKQTIHIGPETTEEIVLKIKLEELRLRYQAEAQPLLDRLSLIEALKLPRIIYVPIDPPPGWPR